MLRAQNSDPRDEVSCDLKWASFVRVHQDEYRSAIGPQGSVPNETL